LGITQGDLDRCFETVASKEGRKEDCFALLYLRNEFGKSVEELHPKVAWGGNDYGIDAFYIDKDRRNLYLYQFKWSKNHNLFRESLQRLISAGMERVFGNPLQDQNQNQMLLQLKSELIENQALIDRVLIHFVFNGDPEAAERSAVLDSLREDLENKKFFINQFFDGRKVDMTFQFRSNETKRLAAITHVRKSFQYTVDFQSAISFGTKDNQNKMYLGFVKLMDLHGMYKEMGLRFFERNIRSGLSPERAPNRSIRQALSEIVLDGKTAPEVFTFNHNGVTLSVEGIEGDGASGKIIAIEPRLLNGAQTLTSVDKFLHLNERNPALKRNEDTLQSIRVLCKIVHSTGQEKDRRDFITNVTICNNKQNKVEPWNLHANDLIQLEFQDKFAEELGIYYERQEKVFESLTDADLKEMGIEDYKAIKLKVLAQTFLAVQGEVDRMSHLGDVFENKKVYDNTFRESYLHANASKILLAYKIHFRLGRILDEIYERGESKYGYITNARELIWALLIQGVLNDDELLYLCEQYGKTLTVEKDYTDYLNGLASKKVRFIVSDVIDGDEDYQKDMADGKYSFLGTKALYERCMNSAHKREKWTKRSL
jgi:hypothetical protein